MQMCMQVCMNAHVFTSACKHACIRMGETATFATWPPPVLVQMIPIWGMQGHACEHVRTQMGEYEYIPDPFQEQRQPRQSGGDGRVPFRPPRLVSDACFALYEVRRHAAHLMQLVAS